MNYTFKNIQIPKYYLTDNGIILIDSKGETGFAYNTPRMAFDYRIL